MNSMIPLKQHARCLFATAVMFAVIMAEQPVFAQWAPQTLPRISRMCLWNGDKTTWSKLNLSRYQVGQMEELRRQYPAVVDAQWVLEDDEVPVATEAAIGQSSPEGVGASAGTQLSTQAPTRGDQLQAELRLVLSAEQIRRWHRLCAGPEEL